MWQARLIALSQPPLPGLPDKLTAFQFEATTHLNPTTGWADTEINSPHLLPTGAHLAPPG